VIAKRGSTIPGSASQCATPYSPALIRPMIDDAFAGAVPRIVTRRSPPTARGPSSIEASFGATTRTPTTWSSLRRIDSPTPYAPFANERVINAVSSFRRAATISSSAVRLGIVAVHSDAVARDDVPPHRATHSSRRRPPRRIPW
jgi:hypothetical protein